MSYKTNSKFTFLKKYPKIYFNQCFKRCSYNFGTEDLHFCSELICRGQPSVRWQLLSLSSPSLHQETKFHQVSLKVSTKNTLNRVF